MFEIYWPKRFCREFVEARGHSCDLTAIMAVISGHKPSADVWVKPADLPQFLQAVKKYGLVARKDILFEMASRQSLPEKIAGKNSLTTTIAKGSLTSKNKNAKYHLFLARTEKALKEAFGLGWYPVIIGQRVIHSPLADTFGLGEALGYPACCCDFFKKYNNWQKFNFYQEVLRNSKGDSHFFCNPLGRNETYTYVAHMPCSFNCAATKRLAGDFRSFLLKKEPELVTQIDRHLQLPHLVFYERKIYAFEGRMSSDGVKYKAVFYLGLNQEFNPYLKRLAVCNELRLEGKDVILLSNGRKRDTIAYNPAHEPSERPFLIQFSS